MAAAALVAALPSAHADAKTSRDGEVVALQPGDTDAQILAKAAHVTPSADQLAWQRQELTAFLHFGPNTFDDREWGTGTEDPSVFNPAHLDTDQWARTLKAAGFKQAMLTVKHHDGLVLFPTRYTTQSVKSSSWEGGHGDVVRDFVASAHKYGLKVGFYVSPADLHEAQPGGRFANGSKSIPTTIPEPGLDGTRPSGPATFEVTADDYNRYYENVLYELLTQYGPVDEVWWDGAEAAGDGQHYDFADWMRIVRALQPHAIVFQGPDIRWVGNEDGVARTDEFSVLPFQGDPAGAADRVANPADPGAADLGGDAVLTQRNADGTPQADYLKWLPAECDTSMQQSGWFWHASDAPKSLSTLESTWLTSVGRNCELLLNVPPDNTGAIPADEVQRLTEFARWRADVFGHPLGHTARAGEIDFPKPTRLGIVGLKENIAAGQRVTSFAVDAWDGRKWTQVTDGTAIGYQRLLSLPNPVVTTKLRLRITGSRAEPDIASFAAFDDGRAVDLAYGKPATQSSTHDGGDASHAVDGNTDGAFGDGSITHTSDTVPDPLPWWQVDLGSSQHLGRIDVYNRTDCCADRLANYWVFASGTPFDTTKTPEQQAATPGVWSSHQSAEAGSPTTIEAGAQGRYVLIQQTSATVLSLAEVRISS